jgi:hypothetical protein
VQEFYCGGKIGPWASTRQVDPQSHRRDADEDTNDQPDGEPAQEPEHDNVPSLETEGGAGPGTEPGPARASYAKSGDLTRGWLILFHAVADAGVCDAGVWRFKRRVRGGAAGGG